MDFVADENIPRQLVEALRGDGHVVVSISSVSPRALDEAVLRTSFENDAILVTIDKDFGELVFRQHRDASGVLLLRLAGLPTSAKVAAVIETIRTYGDQLAGAFTVVAPGRVRMRRHPG